MIVAARSKEVILDMLKTEKHITSCFHSIGMYDTEENSFFTVMRGRGDLVPSCLNETGKFYQIIFQTIHKEMFIQPAELYQGEHIEFLWMEGELSDIEIAKMQSEGQTEDKWSVRLFLRHLLGSKIPAIVDGKFACLYSDGLEVYAFRNDFGALFCDDNLTVCTKPFKGSTTLPANRVYRIDFDENKFVSIGAFETYHKMEIWND